MNKSIRQGMLSFSHECSTIDDAALSVWWKVKLIPCGKGEVETVYVSGLNGMTKEEVQKNLSGNGYFAVARKIAYDKIVKETYYDLLN